MPVMIYLIYRSKPEFLGRKQYKLVLVLCAFLICLFANTTQAQVAGPGWVTERAPLISIEQAQEFYGASSSTIPQENNSTTTLQVQSSESLVITSSAIASSIANSDPEIRELARGLQNDAVLIYEYVLNNIDYVPYYGHLKGPVLTLLERSGNDFDQAELLISLLRVAGFTADFVHGEMFIPTMSAANQQDVAHWFDVSEDVNTISTVLGAGGIPGSVNSVTTQVSRVWVRVTTPAGTFDLDPAFKVYDRNVGINLATAMGYSQPALLSAAGGVTGTDYVQNLNENGLTDQLTNLSNTLTSYIKTNHANASISDIVGGSALRKTSLTELPVSLPFAQTINGTWAEIPSQYIHTIRLQIAGLDKTLNISDVAGKKLSIRTNSAKHDFGTISNSQSSERTVFTYENTSIEPPYNCFSAEFTIAQVFPVSAFTVVSDFIPVPIGDSYTYVVKFDGAGESEGIKIASMRMHNSYCFSGPVQDPVPPVWEQTIELFGQVENTTESVGTASLSSGPTINHELWLEDTLIGSVPASSAGNIFLDVFVDHKYSSVNFADQSSRYTLKKDSSYVLISDFGGSHDGLLLKQRQKKLSRYRADSYSNASRQLLTETLNVIGQTWMRQTTLTDGLLQEMTGTHITNHHRFGLVAQETGYYLDVKTQLGSIVPRDPAVNQDKAFVKMAGFILSALEHSVLEQLQGADYPAVSTVKLISLANKNGNKIFRADSANFASIQSQLSGYNLSALQNELDNASLPTTLILPSSGQIALQQWKGEGYVSYGESGSSYSIGMIIGGGYFGGYGGIPAYIQPTPVYNSYIPALNPVLEIPRTTSLDPVDLYTGGFVYSHQDLAIGQGEPRGLSFTRYYDSNQNNQKGDMGFYGWTHNYDINLSIHSDLSSAVGRRKPEDAVAMLVAAYAAADLLTPSNPEIKAWTVAALIAQWVTDEFFENAASVQKENQSLKYIKLPDGSFSLPPGVTTSLVEDVSGLLSLHGRFGDVTDFNVDNKVSTITDVDGNALTFTYYASGISVDRLQSVSDDYGHSIILEYVYGQLSQVTSAGLTVSYLSTDDNGNLDAYTDPDGKVWTYGYQDHLLTTVGDPLPTTLVTNTYDSLNRVINQIVPRDTGTATYDLFYSGFRSIEEDQDGDQTIYFFDKKGRRTALQDALGNTTKFEYDNNNNVMKQTDPRGNETQFIYDDDLNMRYTTNALSQQTENVYDSLHRLMETIDPLAHSTDINYDAEHHVMLRKDALGNEFTATYYSNGQRNTSTDGRNNVTSLAYDEFGNLDTSKINARPVVDTNYDDKGLMQSLTDQAGNTTSFVYDNRYNITQVTDALQKTTVMTYDDANRLDSVTDRNQQVIGFDYTPLGKVKKITLPDASTISFTYTDDMENLDTMTDSLGVTNYNYDIVNRLTSKTDAQGNQVSYSYDAAGNIVTLTYPDNKTVTYTHDALNRVKIVSIDWLNQTAEYFYDAAGRLDSLQNFNGTLTDYSYDDANRLTGIDHTANTQTIFSMSYPQLDGNGNPLQEIREEAQVPVSLLTESIDFTYNAQNNRLNSTTNDAFTYDDEGQTIQKNSTDYTWDAQHRLMGIGNAQHFYDGAGMRLKSIRDGVTTKYVYDASGNLLAETSNTGVISRYYIHGLGMLGFVENNQSYVYHHDQVGSTQAITDQSADVINAYSYTPYGLVVDQQESIQQPFKYVGKFGVYAETNGLYYMRARYYDPETTRFISEDPIGFEGGLNLYRYASGNPIMNVDPSGLVDWPNLGFGLVDFGLSSVEAVGGLGAMIASPVLGPAAPVGFTGGLLLAGHGSLGMANSGLAIQNALNDTSGPGLLESAGGALFGGRGAAIGQGLDLFTGLRGGTAAAGALNSASDVYNAFSTGNTVRNAFGNRGNQCGI